MKTTTVSAETAPTLISELSAATTLAIDTEFHSERRHSPELFLVQLRIENGDIWIIDPLDTEVFAIVAPAIANVPWIVHSGEHDIGLLNRTLGSAPEVIYDTQLAAGFFLPYYPASLKVLLSSFLSINADKSQTLTNWSQRPLTPDQIQYAADDVSDLHALWHAMWSQLTEEKQTALLLACDESRTKAIAGQVPDEQWKRIGARRVMKGRQLNVLQATAAWREREAAERGVPARAVLPDGVMVDVARRLVTDPKQLLSNRRLPKGARRHVPTLIELAQTEESIPPIKSVFRGSKQAQTLLFVDAATAALAGDFGAAPEFLVPPNLREAIALCDSEAELTALLGWREPLIGEKLRNLLSGRQSLVCQWQGIPTIR